MIQLYFVKKVIAMVSLLMAISYVTHAQNIYVVKVPDANFKAELFKAGVDKNKDGVIQVYEAKVVQTLNLSGKNIQRLNGIEAFVNLKTLYCSSNSLDSLDVSHNKFLTELNCCWNHLRSLNVTGCNLLVDLGCADNYLAKLDLTTNTSLKYLNCMKNSLIDLKIKNQTDLVELNCSKNIGLKTVCLGVSPTDDFIKDETTEWKQGC